MTEEFKRLIRKTQPVDQPARARATSIQLNDNSVDMSTDLDIDEIDVDFNGVTGNGLPASHFDVSTNIEIENEATIRQGDIDVFELPIDTDVKGDTIEPAEGIDPAPDAKTGTAKTNAWPKPPARPVTQATDSSANGTSQSSSATQKASSFGSRTFTNNNWGRKTRDFASDNKSVSYTQPASSDKRRIFGSATEARRQRKGRGVSAAAAAIVGRPEQIKRVDSMALLRSAIAQNTDIKRSDIRGRDEAYRKIPAKLPASWSSKLVDCQTKDNHRHRVMFLWNETDLNLFIYDTATNAIRGAEIEAEYAKWEHLPSSFLHRVHTSYSNGVRQRLINKVWPFSRSKR